MNKEEAIKKIIDMTKDGVEKPFEAYCHSNPCICCPFYNDVCVEAMIGGLIDALIKAEEKKETNLEHYAHCFHNDGINEGVVRGELYLDGEACELALKSYDLKEFVSWLLSPYEKPRYKLSKFEYDLLKCYDPSYVIIELWLLTIMQSKGYYKDIPTNVSIKDILANCEVVEE